MDGDETQREAEDAATAEMGRAALTCQRRIQRLKDKGCLTQDEQDELDALISLVDAAIGRNHGLSAE